MAGCHIHWMNITGLLLVPSPAGTAGSSSQCWAVPRWFEDEVVVGSHSLLVFVMSGNQSTASWDGAAGGMGRVSSKGVQKRGNFFFWFPLLFLFCRQK